MMISLTPAQRRFLRAQAHALQPAVMIGQQGITPALLRELDQTLTKHELVKVRLLSVEREERETVLAQLCEAVQAAPVQQIGKILVLYRPAPEPKLALPH